MATYKVIQDIEAEDKLLGPLTLRQFIYAAIVVVTGFIAFRIALVSWPVALPLVPPIIFFALLAAPFGHDQPSEVWMLAKIRFYLKPRRRIWNQSGVKELVTITAPKRIEQVLTKDYSQTEVRSRLQALANTIDSRGWAVKNVNVNLFAQPAYATAGGSSDRLISTAELPQEVSVLDIQPADDMLDEHNNPIAQNLDRMIGASSVAHRQQVVQKMTAPAPVTQQGTPAGGTPDYWFMSQNQAPTAPGYTTLQSKVVAPGTSQPAAVVAKKATPEEQALLEQLHTNQEKPKAAYGHMRTISPIDDQKAPASQQPAPTPAVTPDPAAVPDPAVLGLANNNDLNVETIARQANKRKQEPPTDEVVVSLH